MAGFNILDFNATLMGLSGVQKPNLFNIEIPIPNGLLGLTSDQGQSLFTDIDRNINFLCKSSSLPGILLATEDNRRYGYGPVQKKPFVPLFTNQTLLFIGDGEGNILNFFQTWLKYSVNYDTRQGIASAGGIGGPQTGTKNVYAYELNYLDDYQSDPITIHTYYPDGTNLSDIMLTRAYPIAIQEIILDWELQNQYMLIPVIMSYFDWYSSQLITTAQST